MTFWEKLFGWMDKGTPDEQGGDTRTAIKSQGEPELEMTDAEMAIADAFESLPRQCRRAVERKNPKGWLELDSYTRSHTVAGHRPGGKSCT
jgi:hypothetical protein